MPCEIKLEEREKGHYKPEESSKVQESTKPGQPPMLDFQRANNAHEVNPSTHRFFQMFLLRRSSGKDRWGRPEGGASDSSSEWKSTGVQIQ